jgi:hypothetical protein
MAKHVVREPVLGATVFFKLELLEIDELSAALGNDNLVIYHKVNLVARD